MNISDETLRTTLKSQYHASLAMLKETIERCPDEVWFSNQHKNAFWQGAYHVLFFVHLYLQPNEAAFHLWEGQHSDGDGTSGQSYTREQVLSYWNFCNEFVDSAVDALDLQSQESGFYWYQMSKLEHQFVNIRHIQHHTAQLADRLRAAVGIGIQWHGAGGEKKWNE